MGCVECDRRGAYMAADPEMYRDEDKRCECHRQLAATQAKLDAAVALAGILHRLVDDGVILYAGRVSDRERSTMIRLERRIATESETVEEQP